MKRTIWSVLSVLLVLGVGLVSAQTYNTGSNIYGNTYANANYGNGYNTVNYRMGQPCDINPFDSVDTCSTDTTSMYTGYGTNNMDSSVVVAGSRTGVNDVYGANGMNTVSDSRYTNTAYSNGMNGYDSGGNNAYNNGYNSYRTTVSDTWNTGNSGTAYNGGTNTADTTAADWVTLRCRAENVAMTGNDQGSVQLRCYTSDVTNPGIIAVRNTVSDRTSAYNWNTGSGTANPNYGTGGTSTVSDRTGGSSGMNTASSTGGYGSAYGGTGGSTSGSSY